MKTSLVALLSLLLGVVVTVVILDAAGVNFDPHEIEMPLSCVDDKRYVGTDDVSAADYIEEGDIMHSRQMFLEHMYHTAPRSECYGDNPPADCPREGAFISKKVIDALLGSDLSANGVMCHFAWDEAEDKMGIIVSASKQQSVEVNHITDRPNYLIKSYCPPKCDFARESTQEQTDTRQAN